MSNTEFINKIAALVQKYAPFYGICVYSPIIAQAILESASGTSELAVNANNFFGLKWRENRCPSASGEYIKIGSEQNPDGSYVSSVMKWFKFPDMDAGVKGYFDFINTARYANLKGVNCPRTYLENIRSDGYATSLRYVDNLLAVIDRYGLQWFDNAQVQEENTMNSIKIHQILLTKNDCYSTGQRIAPKGIIVHSTGANNKTLKRYIAPDDGIIGKNIYNNHWNKSGVSKCVHAFIGADDSGKVRIYQTLPFLFRAWGCGTGKNGSYNDSYIHFEICEDNLKDAVYFYEAFYAAADLCAYLMKLYPNIKLENVISHKEAHQRGFASNHRDCDHWLAKFDKNMDWFRSQVETRLKVVSDPAEVPETSEKESASEFPYLVKITALSLNVRAGAGTSFKKNTAVRMNEVYTIVDEKMNGSVKWGKLKSGAGWISLKYTKRV